MKQIKWPEIGDTYLTDMTGIGFIVTKINKDKMVVYVKLKSGEDKKEYPIKIDKFYSQLIKE